MQLRDTIGGALERRLNDGTFRRRIEPIDLYISIASLCFFYHSNAHTMSVIFQRELMAESEIERRRSHIVEMVMGYLVTD